MFCCVKKQDIGKAKIYGEEKWIDVKFNEIILAWMLGG